MPIPDPIVTGVTTAAALQVAKQAQDFLAAAIGHPGETIGTVLGKIFLKRKENAEAVASKAHVALPGLGLRPREVELNILHPILESASLHNDADIQETWANLLANAADPRREVTVEPSFPSILKELTSREVKFLSTLFEEAQYNSQFEYTDQELLSVFQGERLKTRHSFAFDRKETPKTKEYIFLLDVLQRQQVLVTADEFEPIHPYQVMARS
jgi:hypothetical protein